MKAKRHGETTALHPSAATSGLGIWLSLETRQGQVKSEADVTAELPLFKPTAVLALHWVLEDTYTSAVAQTRCEQCSLKYALGSI